MDLKAELNVLLDKYVKSEGTDRLCAIRDVLTDLMHICHDNCYLFYNTFEMAREVYEEESKV